MLFQINNRKRFPKRAAIVIAVVASFFLLHLFSAEIISFTRNAFTPVFSHTASVLYKISDLKSYFKTVDYYKNENIRLNSRISELERNIMEMSGDFEKLSRLESVLELKKTVGYAGYNSVCATVVGGGIKRVIIDCGTSDGIQIENSVLSSDGVVGFVSEVSENYSVIETFESENFSVFARNVRTGDLCRIKTESGRLLVTNSRNIPREGDIFETSGTYGGFVGGILIGKVSEKFENNGVLCSVINPFVNIYELKEVIVVSND